jgi:hypothetical protein
MAGTYNNSTAIGTGATITASNQMVLGTSGSSLSVLIPSTNTSALIVGGVSVGASLGLMEQPHNRGISMGTFVQNKNSGI